MSQKSYMDPLMVHPLTLTYFVWVQETNRPCVYAALTLTKMIQYVLADIFLMDLKLNGTSSSALAVKLRVAWFLNIWVAPTLFEENLSHPKNC